MKPELPENRESCSENPALRVRVVMPVYNYAAYVANAIDSVLRQSEKSWELWIVDDGSSDATPDICRRYEKQDSRIHLAVQQNSGQYSIVNRYSVSDARYSAVLDGDDQLTPDYLAAMYEFAESRGCDVVLGSQRIIGPRQRLWPRYTHSRKQAVFGVAPQTFGTESNKLQQANNAPNQSENWQNLVFPYLQGVFPMPDCGMFTKTALRAKLASSLPELPLYAATDDLQAFVLAAQARRIGHIGCAKYLRNTASSGTWRNKSAEFRLRKVYSILFSLSYMLQQISEWPPEWQQQMTSCYVLRWLRYSLLRNFYGLEPSEQCKLLQAAVRQIHNLQDEVRISPQEQIALLADMPACLEGGKKILEEGLLRRLRSVLRDFLPYGYVMHKKGDAPTRRR